MTPKRVIICTDGASLGNPGPAAVGAVVEDEQGRLIARISQSIGPATNNQAEYMAIITALEEAFRLGVEEADVRSDSELVVRQIKGEYRVKNASLKPLYQRIKRLQGVFKAFTISHIPGQQNNEAHKLAHLALK
ncbi:MAG: ribonuclease HI family protein [Dehalococcoidia bacterium]|jgi:ribonuclease HI